MAGGVSAGAPRAHGRCAWVATLAVRGSWGSGFLVRWTGIWAVELPPLLLDRPHLWRGPVQAAQRLDRSLKPGVQLVRPAQPGLADGVVPASSKDPDPDPEQVSCHSRGEHPGAVCRAPAGGRLWTHTRYSGEWADPPPAAPLARPLFCRGSSTWPRYVARGRSSPRSSSPSRPGPASMVQSPQRPRAASLQGREEMSACGGIWHLPAAGAQAAHLQACAGDTSQGA